MSNDTASLSRADAYVTGLPQSEFACRIYTFYRQELEVVEARHGFIPLSGEMVASRVRRRYRLIKGGHPFLVLVHYSRGQSVRQSFLFSFVLPFRSLHSLSFRPLTSCPASSARPAGSTVPVAPASQRAGRLRSGREARAARTPFRSRCRHASERRCGRRRGGRRGRGRQARRTSDACAAKSRDGGARAA